MKIDKSMGVLHSFTWDYVKYANMEGFRRDSHIYFRNSIQQPRGEKPKIPDSSDDGMYLVIYTSGLKPGEHHWPDNPLTQYVIWIRPGQTRIEPRSNPV